MKTLKETREIVFDRMFERLENECDTRCMEKSIADYTATHMKLNYRTEELHWGNKTTRRIYLRKYRSIMFNIANIKRLLQNGESPQDIVNMKCYEIDPSRWEGILDAIKNREIASLVAYTDDVHDGLLTCYQCKSRKTRYTTLQTRSGDEPTTVFARCCSCGFTWTE